MTRHVDDVRLRAGGTEDIAALTALSADAFDARYGERWTGTQLVGTLSQPGIWVDIVEATEGPVGFSLARLVVDEAELLLVATAPLYRRSGLGRQLVLRALKTAKTRGAAGIFLEVRESNVAAIRLYRSIGFHEIGRRKGYYRGSDGTVHDALTMRRRLITD